MAWYKKYLFAAASTVFAAGLLLFIYPFFSYTIAETDTHHIAEAHIAPHISHFAVLELKATSDGSTQFPQGTAELIWGKEPLARERFDIFIDNLAHSYYVPLGENMYWQKAEEINNLTLSLPRVEGIGFEVEKIRLQERVFFPMDSYINSYFKNFWQIDYINRFLVPSYMMLAFTAILTIIYLSVFKASLKLNPVVVTSVAILIFFSAYFFSQQYYTARSYWASYKTYIQQKDFADIYQGFYDFRRFVSWVDQRLPEGENLAVLLRGEPVYVMSEMAYSLYPRDIRFINISQKNNIEIIKEIRESSQSGYPYIVILSPEDRIESFRLNLLDSYREQAGYIYRFSKE